MTNDDFMVWKGRTHKFGDGSVLRVVDAKQRETGPWITYQTEYPHAIPKRYSLKMQEFIDTFGHLFQKD